MDGDEEIARLLIKLVAVGEARQDIVRARPERKPKINYNSNEEAVPEC